MIGIRIGFLGFHTDGRPDNTFTLIHYGLADPGQRITARQTGAPESAGSLAGWRRLRGVRLSSALHENPEPDVSPDRQVVIPKRIERRL